MFNLASRKTNPRAEAQGRCDGNAGTLVELAQLAKAKAHPRLRSIDADRLDQHNTGRHMVLEAVDQIERHAKLFKRRRAGEPKIVRRTFAHQLFG